MAENGLPEGWATAPLAVLVDRIRDGSHNPPPKQRSGYPMLSARDIENFKIDFNGGRRITTDAYRKEDARTRVRPGSVLLTIVGSIGRSAVVPVDAPSFTLQRSVAVMDPVGVDPHYCTYFFHSKAAQDWLEENAAGSAQRGVYLRTLAGLDVPISPLAEQKRIVAMVEKLLARVNAARERLANVPAILKRFRQSVLAADCSGRLTADWRAAHPDIEPASKLVQRVVARRKSEYEAACRKAKRAGERPPKRPTNLSVSEVDASELPETPEVWAWVYLPHVGYMNRGKSRHRPRNAPHLYGGPYPFIQTGDIAQSGGRITNHRQTYSEEGLAQSRLWREGTICITIAANIADSAILTYPACFPDSVVGVLPDDGLCSTEYVEYFIRTARDDLSQFAPATAQKNINIGILNELAVPVPPLNEQHEIVRRVESLFKLADTIEQRVTAGTQRADKLTQAILAKAFRGELVPTEAELARREGRDLPAPRPGVWFVYAVRCDEDSLYIGQTEDLAKRWEEHLSGHAADWTRQHRPLHVAHYEEVDSREAAVQREKWLKTGFGRKWLKREIAAGRARQAGYEPASALLERIKAERKPSQRDSDRRPTRRVANR